MADTATSRAATSRAAALEWADAARSARLAVREDLRSGERSIEDVLAHRDEPLLGAVKLLWALESVPGARKIDTRRALTSIGVDHSVLLGELDADTVGRVLAACAPVADS